MTYPNQITHDAAVGGGLNSLKNLYFVVSPPRRICRAAWVYGKKGIWYNVCVNGDVYGTCKDEKIGGYAEAATRDPPSPRLRWIKGGDEASAGEEGRGAIIAFT